MKGLHATHEIFFKIFDLSLVGIFVNNLGSFKNYVYQFLSYFDHLPSLTIVDFRGHLKHYLPFVHVDMEKSNPLLMDIFNLLHAYQRVQSTVVFRFKHVQFKEVFSI
jgi:hypothetical protein